jgi:hypothetical protein
MVMIHCIEDVLTQEELAIFAQHISTTSKDDFPIFPSAISNSAIKQRVKLLVEIEFGSTVSDYDFLGLDYNVFSPGEKQDVHTDFSKRADRPDFSSIVYWSKDFDGGEIYFPDDGVEIKPKAGSLIFWSNPVLHGVKEVTRGDRYATSFFWVKR